MNSSIQPSNPDEVKRRRIPVEFIETRQEYPISKITGTGFAADVLQLSAQHPSQRSLFPIVQARLKPK